MGSFTCSTNTELFNVLHSDEVWHGQFAHHSREEQDAYDNEVGDSIEV